MGFGIQGEAYNYYMSLDDKTKEYVRGKLSFADFGKNGFANMSDIGASIMLAGMQWFSRFYTSNNLPDQTRGRYSEVDIEIQDVSEGVTEYKKIQPTSIICFEYKKTLAERELTFDHYQTLAYLAQDSEDYASSMNAIV